MDARFWSAKPAECLENAMRGIETASHEPGGFADATSGSVRAYSFPVMAADRRVSGVMAIVDLLPNETPCAAPEEAELEHPHRQEQLVLTPVSDQTPVYAAC